MITHVIVENEHEIDKDPLSLKRDVKHPSFLSKIFYCLSEHRMFFFSVTQQLQ